ncbi:MAG TPA: C13 family peptidase [Steroidobacteraceae bacterium]|nr:C13 family peptidase [Steroidobacteraceae bacterium]
MTPISIRTQLTLDDWHALRAAYGQRTFERVSVRSRLLRLLPFFFAAMIATWLLEKTGVQFDGVTFLLGASVAVALVIVSSRMTMRRSLPDPDGVFLSELTHEFSAEGIHSKRPGIDSRIAWSCIKEITATAQLIFLWTDRYQGVLVPIRDLPEGMSADTARAQFEAWRTGTHTETVASESPQMASETAERPEPAPSWFRALSQLLILRNAPRVPERVSLCWIFGLALMLIGAWIVIDWWDKRPDGEFYAYNVPMLAWFALGMLSLSTVASAMSIPRVDLRQTLLLTLAACGALLIAISAASYVVPDELWWLIDCAALVYVFVFWQRALRSLTGGPQLRAALAVVIAVLGLGWLSSALYVDASVWTPPEDTSEADAVWRDGEQILFDQPARIDAALEQVAPSTDHTAHNFFLGFAGVGEQRVFAEEIALASKEIDARFSTKARTLELINDKRDFESAPLATVSGLRYALSGLAQRMNLQQDVLFLSISSHGSDDPLIAVSNAGLPLANLSPEELSSALNDAGIQWRVIVISACHAGGFIDALQNDKTIVITAAAADRVSFGCADDRDLTYFGEAFYRDALPKAHSLRDAFEAAKREIAERERNEGFASSKPQAYFGKEIENKLAAILPSGNA